MYMYLFPLFCLIKVTRYFFMELITKINTSKQQHYLFPKRSKFAVT